MATLAARSAIASGRRTSLFGRIWASYELGRSRARLRELPDHLLADIGVSRAAAEREGARSSWDVPGWWRS